MVLTVVSWAFGLSVGQTRKDLQPQHVNQLEFANHVSTNMLSWMHAASAGHVRTGSQRWCSLLLSCMQTMTSNTDVDTQSNMVALRTAVLPSTPPPKHPHMHHVPPYAFTLCFCTFQAICCHA